VSLGKRIRFASFPGVRAARLARFRGNPACDGLTNRAPALLHYVVCRRGQQTPGRPKAVRPSKFCSTLEVPGSLELSIWTNI